MNKEEVYGAGQQLKRDGAKIISDAQYLMNNVIDPTIKFSEDGLKALAILEQMLMGNVPGSTQQDIMTQIGIVQDMFNKISSTLQSNDGKTAISNISFVATQVHNLGSALMISSDEYAKAAITNLEGWLHKKHKGTRLPTTKTSCTFPSKWKPELDVTPELGDEDASYYQQQIGVLRWIVELGRIDICTEVSMLAAYSANPREGHLAAVIHLFAYLKGNPSRSRTVFDPTPMEHDPQVESLERQDLME